MVISSRRFSRLIAAGAAIGLLVLLVHPAAASNDPLFDKQWSLAQSNVPAAWATTTGGGVKIGIVDSGVNRNHDDLKDRVVESATCTDTGGNESSCTTSGDAGSDIAGHGSHVAGIAAATMGNGVGVAGVAPSAKIVVARVFKPSSNGPTATFDDVKAGIEWVVSHGAKVVNLSLGNDGGLPVVGLGGNQGSPLGAAVQAAWDRGAIPVLAAGNGNDTLFGADGSYGDLDAIVVGATIRSGAIASYSNGLTAGTKYGMVAPGGDNNGVDADMILSTFAGSRCSPASGPSCYAYLSGTSMAAPMVAGAAALLLSQGLTRDETVQTLLSTADKVACGSGCQGRLNVGKAVAARATSNGGTAPSSGGSNTNGTATTSANRRRSAATTSVPNVVTDTPTTSEPELTPDTTVEEATPTTTREKREAIVLNTPSGGDSGVPAVAGAAGVGLLGAAAVGTVLRARRARLSSVSS